MFLQHFENVELTLVDPVTEANSSYAVETIERRLQSVSPSTQWVLVNNLSSAQDSFVNKLFASLVNLTQSGGQFAYVFVWFI